MKTLKAKSGFNFQPRCQKQLIIQFSFADDLLLFIRGDIQSMKMVYECFQEFSEVSGLIANQTKSSVYFEEMIEEYQEDILQYIGFKKGMLLFKYLGVPESEEIKLTINQCQPLIDRMLQSIQSWTVNFLSYARRL